MRDAELLNGYLLEMGTKTRRVPPGPTSASASSSPWTMQGPRADGVAIWGAHADHFSDTRKWGLAEGGNGQHEFSWVEVLSHGGWGGPPRVAIATSWQLVGT